MLTRTRLAWIVAIVVLLATATVVYAATFQQGYNTGCSLGSMETFFEENLTLYNATMQMSFDAGEIEYANGVEGGYAACRFTQPPVTGGRGVGTVCNIDGCGPASGNPDIP